MVIPASTSGARAGAVKGAGLISPGGHQGPPPLLGPETGGCSPFLERQRRRLVSRCSALAMTRRRPMTAAFANGYLPSDNAAVCLAHAL
jgi:hypothetical protein